MEKAPSFFLVFLHFYPFLFIPVFCFLFLFILLDCSVSFPGSKNYSQNEHFLVQSFAPKSLPFQIPNFGFQVVILQFQNEQFFGGQLFIQFRFANLEHEDGIWKKHLDFSFFFAFLSIPLHSRLLFLIPFYFAWLLCFLSGIQKL